MIVKWINDVVYMVFFEKGEVDLMNSEARKFNFPCELVIHTTIQAGLDRIKAEAESEDKQ